MGSFPRGDSAHKANGNTRHAEVWKDFGSANNSAYTQEDPGIALLARAIQHEIIPRLMLVHRQNVPCQSTSKSPVTAISHAEVQEFSGLLLQNPEQPAFAMLEALRTRGVRVEALYLQLLAPAARALGKLWEEDICDFTEVTVGMGRVQRMLNLLSPMLEQPLLPNSNGLSILLLSTPGEQHTFGLAMAADFFRSAGWEVSGGPGTGSVQAVSLLKKRRFDAVGLSLAGVIHLDALTQMISTVRVAAGTQPLCIIVGGPAVASHSEHVAQVGADLVATNVEEAPGLVQKFVKASTSCSNPVPCTSQ
jgi:methanogenic corrinoid protein MtbC1